MKHTIARVLMAGGVAGGVIMAAPVAAIDFNITGFLRQEISYGIAASENPNNEMSETFNGRINYNITNGGYGTGGDTGIIGLRTAAGAAGGAGFNASAPTSLFVDAAGRVGGLFAAGAAEGVDTNPDPNVTTQFFGAGAFTSLARDCHLN